MPSPGRGTVLLFRPVADPVSRCGGAWIPYSLLSLAGAVSEAGFPVRLTDGYHDGDPEGILDARDGSPALVGITVASAHQVQEGLRFAGLVRERFPGVPIVWGGPRATEHPLIDAVVRGPGEGALLGILGVPQGGGSRPLRPYRFDLLPVRRYVTERPGLPGRRIVSYFPGDMDPVAAVENLLVLLEVSGANTAYVSEDAFFSRPRRTEAFCAALRARAPGIAWIADARSQDLEAAPAAFWDLLAGSGLRMLRLGLEPGPPVSDALLETCRRRGILAECAVSEAEAFGEVVSFLDRVMRANPANKILVLKSRGEGSSHRLAFLQRVHHYAWMPEELKAAYGRKGRPMAAFYANHLLARLRWRLRFFSFPVEHWLGESGLNRLVEWPLGLLSRRAGIEAA